MILAAALGLQLARALRSTPPRLDPGALADRYRRECGGGARGVECTGLQAQLEHRLYDDLRQLYAAGGDADRDTLRIAAGAAYAPLAAFALRRLATGLRPDEESVVLAALESPCPLVRRVAASMLLQMSDPRHVRLLQRVYEPRWTSAETSLGLLPDEPPTAARLGAPIYPGARYRYFPSGLGRAFFTTTDPPAAAIDFYARDTPALTARELDGLLARPPSIDPAALRRYLADGGSRRALKAAWRARDALRLWARDIAAQEGVEELRFVPLAPRVVLGSPVPGCLVAVFRDTVLDATAIVLPTPWVTTARRAATGAGRHCSSVEPTLSVACQ